MKNASIFGGAGTFVRRSVMMTVLLAGTFSVLANAETIYRWVGSNGVVSYGENPPAGAKGVKQIAGAPQQSVSTPAEVQRLPEAAANVQPRVDKPELNASNPARKRWKPNWRRRVCSCCRRPIIINRAKLSAPVMKEIMSVIYNG
jgi:hypothetical protein